MKKYQAAWIFAATKIGALLIFPPLTQASGWDCQKNEAGQWVCGGATSEQATSPVLVIPLAPVDEQPASTAPATTPQSTSTPEPATTTPSTPDEPPTAVEVAPTQATEPVKVVAPIAAPNPAPSPESLDTINQVRSELPMAWCAASENMVEIPQADRNVPANIWSDNASGSSAERHLSGNVTLVRADQRIESDSMTYKDESNEVFFTGQVLYKEDGLAISGERGWVDLDTNQGKIEPAEYRMPLHSINGTASKIDLQNRDLIHLVKSTYSTCNPDSPFWTVKSGNLTLDKKKNRGTARNARLNIKGVPVLWSPYYSFPLSKARTSGFLTPTIAKTTRSGMELQVPFYWNIAPNRDAMTSLHHFVDRGTMLDTNYRYLQPDSHGEFTGSYLPSDDLAKKDRWSASYQHEDNYWPRLSTRVNLNRVSDDVYFNDFTNNVQTTSIIALDNEIASTYSADQWSLNGRMFAFQELNAVKQYALLPEVAFNGTLPDIGSNFTSNLNVLATNFTKDSTSVDGQRVDLAPRVQYNWDQLAYYLRPAVTFHQTQYNLGNVAGGADASPSRSVPTFSLDSSVFFEREFNLFQSNLTQTLEPQLFYVYTPKEDQADIPVFDTSQNTETYSELFTENRFTGVDRIGDANQVTAAVTTRFLNADSGYDYGALSLGQRFYFSDREVQLAGTGVDTTDESDLFLLGTANITQAISATSDLQWDPQDGRTTAGNGRLSYRPNTGEIYNLDYRYRDAAYEHVDLSLLMPITHNWKLIGLWNHSLAENRPFETLAGLQYDSCCWMFRFVHRRYLQGAADVGSQPGTDEAVMFQVVLKGLGGLGDDLESILETNILGYQRYTY